MMKCYIKRIWVCTLCSLLLTACTISYKFNGASIDYSLVSTMSISDFPNQSPLVSPTLGPNFTEALKDIYTRQTRLEMVQANGDLELEGEITGYDLTPMAVKEDLYSSETKLTITVRVRYFNRTKPDEDFEQSFSAYTTFDSNTMLSTIQDQLNETITEELVEQIYNATVANW